MRAVNSQITERVIPVLSVWHSFLPRRPTYFRNNQTISETIKLTIIMVVMGK